MPKACLAAVHALLPRLQQLPERLVIELADSSRLLDVVMQQVRLSSIVPVLFESTASTQCILRCLLLWPQQCAEAHVQQVANSSQPTDVMYEHPHLCQGLPLLSAHLGFEGYHPLSLQRWNFAQNCMNR